MEAYDFPYDSVDPGVSWPIDSADLFFFLASLTFAWGPVFERLDCHQSRGDKKISQAEQPSSLAKKSEIQVTLSKFTYTLFTWQLHSSGLSNGVSNLFTAALVLGP